MAQRSSQSSDSRVFRVEAVANGASWLWKGEIFLARIPGSWKEGGAQKLNEDGAGGARFLVPARGEGGSRGRCARVPEQGGAEGSFSSGGSGALTPIDRAKKPEGSEGLAARSGVGRGGVPAAWVPPCRLSTLTALCSPWRGLARGCCGAGPAGDCGCSATLS